MKTPSVNTFSALQYRSDIDGLRAVAVLLVLFNHVGWSLFSGGYVGVDVFFVISGYLISAIVINDITQQKFSLAHFYQKRVLRLAPAFYTVLTVVTLFASLFLLPHELTHYARSVIYSCFFIANIFMAQNVGNYFSGDVSEIPLLHLWSLGVEEQFYLFWPLLLWLFCFVVAKKQAKWGLLFTLALILLSVAYAQVAMHDNISQAYYLMPVRAFELLMGALVYFLPTPPSNGYRRLFYRRLLGVLALAVILGCAIFYDKSTVFPGFAALPVCLATALIIYLGRHQTAANRTLSYVHKPANALDTPFASLVTSTSSQTISRNQLHAPWLSHASMRWVGKISYPLYLWHWPVLVFAQVFMLPQSLSTQLAVILMSILLAYLTYKYIEQPSRRLRTLTAWRTIMLLYAVPTLLFCLLALWIIQAQGWPSRFKPQVLQQVAALQSFSHDIRAKCHNAPKPSQLPKADDCVLGVAERPVDFLVIGDSHANHFTGMLNQWALHAGLRGYDITQDTTLFLPDVQLSRNMNGVWKVMPQFQLRNAAIAAHISEKGKEKRYAMVVMSGYFSVYGGASMRLSDGSKQSSEQVYQRALRRAIALIIASGARPVILMDSPVLQGQKSICPVRVLSLGLDRDCRMPLAQFKAQQQYDLKLLQQLQREFPQIVLVNPNLILCKSTGCLLDINAVPLYRQQDYSHLNAVGSAALGQAYLQQFANPLKTIANSKVSNMEKTTSPPNE